MGDKFLIMSNDYRYAYRDLSNVPAYASIGGGETNTASSAGGSSLVLPKSGVDLPFKGLTSGTGIQLTENANDIQISATVQGGLLYQGTWNASTNVPAIVSSVGTTNHYYLVSINGTTNIDGISSWSVGDWILFNGSVWQKLDHTNDETIPDTQVTMYNIGGGALNLRQNLSIHHSTGWLNGGDITDNLDGSVSVSSGQGFIRPTNDKTSEISSFVWSLVNPLAMVDNSINYIYVAYNGGSPIVTSSTTSLTDVQTNVLLGQVYRQDTTVTIDQTIIFHSNDPHKEIQLRLSGINPFEHESGAILTTTNLTIQLTAGVFWSGMTQFNTSAFDSSVTPITQYYRDGLGGWSSISANNVDNVNYDDNSGTLAPLQNNRYGVRWLYVLKFGVCNIIFGTGNNQTITDATNETPPLLNLPPLIQYFGTLAGRLIVQKNATSFITVNSAFESSFSALPSLNATSVNYDNTTSGLTATNVQTAIDEIDANSFDPTALPVVLGTNFEPIGSNTVSIGTNCGTSGINCVSIGNICGRGTGTQSVHIGHSCGRLGTVGIECVGIGQNAQGSGGAKNFAIGIGGFAGAQNQGLASIAIGYYTGTINQPDRTIMLNATGAQFNSSTADAFYVKPIRSATASNKLLYDSTSGEISYQVDSSGKIATTDTVYVSEDLADWNLFDSGVSLQIRKGTTTHFALPDALNDTVVGFSNVGGVYTGSMNVPRGTTAQRNTTPQEGMARLNSSTTILEYYLNGGWRETLRPDINPVVIGSGASGLGKVANTVVLGSSALGSTTAKAGEIAIGFGASFLSSGDYSISLGYFAGRETTHNNVIIINGNGPSSLNSTGTDRCHIKPIRSANFTNKMLYDTVSAEVTHQPDPVQESAGSIDVKTGGTTDRFSLWSSLTNAQIGLVSGNNTNGGFLLPAGADGDRPFAPSAGCIRYNTTSSSLEYYDGLGWNTINSTPV